MEVPGHRRAGRPKYRGKKKLKGDMQEKNLNEHQVRDRNEENRPA